MSFWSAAWQELHAHRAGVAVALSCMVLLGAVRHLARSREHTIFTKLCLVLYLVAVPLHAVLEVFMGERDLVTLPARVLLAFGTIGTTSSLIFDAALRRFTKMRILRDVTSTIAGIVAVFVLLSKAGVNLSSIVATSAVLTGVIGFALQETLGNVIGGIALQLESTMSIGDWVTVGEVTGQVAEIRWRSTAIITRNDDMVVIPNGLLAKGNVTNLSRPVSWHRQWVHFDVHYRHPPNEVQRVVMEALKGIPNVKEKDPAPDCILYRMEQDHAHYAVRYRLLDLKVDDGTDSEVKKRIWYSLRRHGIEIPYPSRNLFITELSKEREESKWAKEHARRLGALKKVAIFAPLDEEGLDHLADRCRLEVFGMGEVILRQGADGDSLYVIRKGQVAVRVAVDRVEREVALLAEGQLFGEMSLMTGAKRSATVIARSDCECYVIDRALFQEILAKRGSLAHEISEILARRTAELEGDIAELGAQARTHEQRQAALLGRIARFFGLATNGASASTASGGE